MQSAGTDRSKDNESLGKELSTGNGARTAVRYAELPLISVLAKPMMEQARAALTELNDLQKLIEEYAARQDELKSELAVIQAESGVQGLRYGDLIFREESMPGRKTLVATKLMEVAGVTPAQLAECTVTGKGFVKRTFRNLSKPVGKSEDSASG